MVRLAILLAAGICALQSAHASAAVKATPRNIQFSNLNTESGLSSEFVHDVAQDGRGYIWFATQGGLDSFDGHDIRVYESVANDPSTLSHSFIWSLYVDAAGNLWIGTERGVNRYDPATDSFVRRPWPKLNLYRYRIRKIVQDRDGNFWLGTLGDGLLKVNPAKQTLEQFRHSDKDDTTLPNNYVLALLEDSRGRLWVGTDGGGLARFDAATETFVSYVHKSNNPLTISDNQIRSIYEDKAGNIWVGTAQRGLDRLDPASGRFTRFLNDPARPNSLPGGQVTAIFEDKRGTLWVGTENGLAEWRPDIKGFVRYKSDPASMSSLVNNRITAITQDTSGVLWISTYGGVSSWNHFSEAFKYYDEKGGYLKSDQVSSVAETSDGVMWVGTYGGGLSRIDPMTGAVKFYRHDPGQPNSLPDDRVMAVHVDDRDRLWVGTRDGGLALKNATDPGFKRFIHNPNDPGSLSGNQITSIFNDRSGALWVGIFDGGVDLSPNGDGSSFEHFRHNPSDPASLSGDRVLTIYQDQQGTIWLGTENAGLDRFDKQTGKFHAYDLETASIDPGPHGTPWAIRESKDGTMWLGTLGQGLLRWSKKDRDVGRANFKQFAVTQGLASEIYAVIEGGANRLWLSSNRGLFEFNTAAPDVRKFDSHNGLRTNEFNQGAALRSRSGRLLFGSTAGLVGFFPGDLPSNTRPPMVSLDVRSRTATIARTGTDQPVPGVRLNYFNAFVAFDFVALDFTSPDKNRYRYKLVGLDKQWTETQDFRRAVYSSLAPGSYRFEVQASNDDGVWNRTGAQVNVYVVPPPWSTWWAYLVYLVLALVLVGWYLMNQRSRKLAVAATRARLERLVGERTAELAERNAELTDLNKMLEQASVTDALTGLRNRRFVDEHIAAELAMLERSQFDSDGDAGESSNMIFMMMIDLDGFKAINDAFGHHAGDRALLEVKDRLLAGCRKSDVVIRWGGDEFLIIGHARTIEGAEQFADKVRTSLADPGYDIGGGHICHMSGSIGISSIPFVPERLDFVGWEQVCNVADLACYMAKEGGRDRWVSITGTDQLVPEDMTDLRARLPALDREGKLRVRNIKSTMAVVSDLPRRSDR